MDIKNILSNLNIDFFYHKLKNLAELWYNFNTLMAEDDFLRGLFSGLLICIITWSATYLQKEVKHSSILDIFLEKLSFRNKISTGSGEVKISLKTAYKLNKSKNVLTLNSFFRLSCCNNTLVIDCGDAVKVQSNCLAFSDIEKPLLIAKKYAL
jgi:hypothetical protein